MDKPNNSFYSDVIFTHLQLTEKGNAVSKKNKKQEDSFSSTTIIIYIYHNILITSWQIKKK